VPALPAATETSAGGDDTPAAPLTGRRRFLRWLGGLTIVSTAAMIIMPIVGFLVPTAGAGEGSGGKVLVGTTADIPPGSGKVVAMGSKPAIVVGDSSGYKAFSAICTHLGCVVMWNDLSGVIECPCHGGKFNPASGAVVGGPPPTPLAPITVSVEGDQIFLTGA
jgi:cytochrome b6-f complex iron-sulfur subunit